VNDAVITRCNVFIDFMHERIGKPAHRPNMQITNHPQTYCMFIEMAFFSRRSARSTDRKLPDNRSSLMARGTCCYCSTTHHNRFTAIFPGPPGLAGARGELVDFMVQGKINRQTTDRLAVHHSILLSSAHLHHPCFLQAGCPSCHPTNSVKALKATVSNHRM